jgi:uroporphyrinogen decarboxylase
MRQAGRYLPEYRAVRARAPFLELCRRPELAAEVTLQPIDRFGMDAAVIFSDILVLPEALGLPVIFEDGAGPRLERTITGPDDLARLTRAGLVERLVPVHEAIAAVHAVLAPRGIPVLGFAGAPFTLACYCVDGGTSREYPRTRRLMRREPAVFAQLLDILAQAAAQHLIAQARAGAAAVQVFDSWAGLLGRDDYRAHALPPLRALVAEVRRAGVPVIVYANGSAAHLAALRDSGASVVSVDWRLPLDAVRSELGADLPLQGNLDPTALYADPGTVAQQTRAMLAANAGGPLIANLGHGLLPDTPVESVQAFVQTVKESAG